MLQGEVDPVIIYGCGINGIHLYYRIRNNCNIIAFADRSENKQGYRKSRTSEMDYDIWNVITIKYHYSLVD